MSFKNSFSTVIVYLKEIISIINFVLGKLEHESKDKTPKPYQNSPIKQPVLLSSLIKILKQ